MAETATHASDPSRLILGRWKHFVGATTTPRVKEWCNVFGLSGCFALTIFLGVKYPHLLGFFRPIPDISYER